MEGHGGPVFYYLIVLFIGFMPWFGYLLLGFFRLPLRTAGNPGHRFLRLFTIFSCPVCDEPLQDSDRDRFIHILAVALVFARVMACPAAYCWEGKGITHHI